MRLATASAVRACAVPSVFSLAGTKRTEAPVGIVAKVGPQQRLQLETAMRRWRELAMQWVRLMPLAMRAIDGSLRINLPAPGSDDHFRAAGLEPGPHGSWNSGTNPLGPAAFELGRQSRRVASVCAPHGFRVGSLLRFEHRLESLLPSVAHYTLSEDAEFEIMEIELALGIDPNAPRAINWDEPLNAGPEAVLRALVKNVHEIKVGNLLPQIPVLLLIGTEEKPNKVKQLRRWLVELSARNPPLAEIGSKGGYYRATEQGTAWLRLHSK